MKPLIFIIFILSIAYGALNTWVGVTQNAELGSNWSLGARADSDTLYFDGSSSVACSLSIDTTVCSGFIVSNANQSTIKDGGHVLKVDNGGRIYLDRLAGNPGGIYMSGKLIVTGNSAITWYNRVNLLSDFLWNWDLRGNNVVTSYTGVLRLKHLSCSYTGMTTTIAGQGLEIRGGSLPCADFNGGSWVVNGITYFHMQSSNLAWTGVCSSVTGSSIWQIDIFSYNYSVVIPKLKATISGFNIQSNGDGNSVIMLTDTLQINGQLNFGMAGLSGNTINTNSCVIIADSLYIYNTASTSGNFIFDSPLVQLKRFNTVNQTLGTYNVYFKNTYFKVSEKWTWKAVYANRNVYPEQSTLEINGAATMSTFGSKFNNVKITATSGTVAATDTFTCRTFKNVGGATKTGVWRFCGIDSLKPTYAKVGDSVTAFGTWDTSGLSFKIDTFSTVIKSKTDTTVKIVIPSGALKERHSVIVSQSNLSDTLFYGFCGWSSTTGSRWGLWNRIKMQFRAGFH